MSFFETTSFLVVNPNHKKTKKIIEGGIHGTVCMCTYLCRWLCLYVFLVRGTEDKKVFQQLNLPKTMEKKDIVKHVPDGTGSMPPDSLS
jgi:hypothetical protein